MLAEQSTGVIKKRLPQGACNLEIECGMAELHAEAPAVTSTL
jgi:hypothetical protein